MRSHERTLTPGAARLDARARVRRGSLPRCAGSRMRDPLHRMRLRHRQGRRALRHRSGTHSTQRSRSSARAVADAARRCVRSRASSRLGTSGLLGAAGHPTIRRHLFLKSLAKHAPRLLGDLGGLNLATGAITPRSRTARWRPSRDAPRGSRHARGRRGVDPDRGVVGGLGRDPRRPHRADRDVDRAPGRSSARSAGSGPFNDGGLVAAIADVRAKYAAWQSVPRGAAST